MDSTVLQHQQVVLSLKKGLSAGQDLYASFGKTLGPEIDVDTFLTQC